jgi:putative ABC transport system permease protein
VVTGNVQAIYGAANTNTAVIGTSPDYLEIREWGMADGVGFTESDVRSGTRVALIGRTAAETLFPGENPVGKTVRLQQSPFLIIGLLARKGQSMDGRDQDDCFILPLTTAQRQLIGSQFAGSLRMIMVKAESSDALPAVEQDVAMTLRLSHRIAEGSEDDFDVRNLTAVANSELESAQVMTWLLGAIASVSLLVGGIGIMNIMLVSVTERTAEIGVRMAIGARRRDILEQFLVEAVLVAVGGSVIGLLAGLGSTWIAENVSEMTTVITMDAVTLAFVVAAVVGVVFGFYPAWRAAQLNPIEALRYQ